MRLIRVSTVLAVSIASIVACGSQTDTSATTASAVTVPTTDPEPTDRAPAGRMPTFGLVDVVDGYRLEVAEVGGRGGQAIALHVTHDGDPVETIESDYMHVFTMGTDLSYFGHEATTDWSSWMNVDDVGPAHVVVLFADDIGEVTLSSDVRVDDASDFRGGIPTATQTGRVTASGVLIERDGWNFTAIGTRDLPVRSYPAWLTVVRQDDLALSYQSIDQAGDGVYAFAPVLPGAGDYLAVLEIPGAPAFSFFVTVDASGNFGARPEHELIDAVSAFVDAIDRADADLVLEMMSSRCRSILPPTLDGDLAQHVDPSIRHWLTSAVADIDGETATVDYVTIEGDYSPGATPRWSSRHETWVREDQSWRRDTCDPGYFGW